MTFWPATVAKRSPVPTRIVCPSSSPVTLSVASLSTRMNARRGVPVAALVADGGDKGDGDVLVGLEALSLRRYAGDRGANPHHAGPGTIDHLNRWPSDRLSASLE